MNNEYLHFFSSPLQSLYICLNQISLQNWLINFVLNIMRLEKHHYPALHRRARNQADQFFCQDVEWNTASGEMDSLVIFFYNHYGCKTWPGIYHNRELTGLLNGFSPANQHCPQAFRAYEILHGANGWWSLMLPQMLYSTNVWVGYA